MPSCIILVGLIERQVRISIVVGRDLDCDEDGDTLFGAMRPATQLNSKLPLRSPSRGRKEQQQRLFFPFGRNSANAVGHTRGACEIRSNPNPGENFTS